MVVGMTGFEPATSCSQSRRAASCATSRNDRRLPQTSALHGIRTRNLLIRGQTLYPIGLTRHESG